MRYLAGNLFLAVFFLVVPLSNRLVAAQSTRNIPVAPKWSRFEQSFKGSIAYPNPLQDAALTVQLISPGGKTNQAYGFWDGGRTWRFRWAPDEVGRWSFRTSCSDTSNRGLHDQTGQFICTAPIGVSRFKNHGPVRVARDHRHFEHVDGTPFFWLADTIWNGARYSDPKDFLFYASTRSIQRFSVAQWSVAPGRDLRGETAWIGTDRIAINLAFFQRLDAKLAILSQAGLLSAIAPLDELDLQPAAAGVSKPGSISSAPGHPPLPDDQATLLLRYIVARWNAEPVAWLLRFEGDAQARQANRWKKIGQSVFGTIAHAPVVIFTGDTPWLLNEFREQPWVDAFAFQTLTDTSDDAAKWVVSGPLSNEWKNEPARPVISFTPPENGAIPNWQARFTSEDVRKAAWWGLLLTQPAGVSYSAHGVLNWDTTIGTLEAKDQTGALPLWHKSLFLPGAKQMTLLARSVDSVGIWQLRPRPEFVATQPGTVSPRRYVAAAGTEKNDLSVAYVPEDRTVDLDLVALPHASTVTWLNPRTGGTNAAVGVVGGHSCLFPTPDPGDWLILMKPGR